MAFSLDTSSYSMDLPLRTDRVGEFNLMEFEVYCSEEGIQRKLTAPYSPQQNGFVECHNQTVVRMVRSMLSGEGDPRHVLGRGGVHQGVHPQLIAYMQPGRENAI